MSPNLITYETETDGRISGCYTDEEDSQKLRCKYRLTADVSFKQDAPTYPTPVLPGRRPSGSSGWQHSTQCEKVEFWTATEVN